MRVVTTQLEPAPASGREAGLTPAPAPKTQLQSESGKDDYAALAEEIKAHAATKKLLREEVSALTAERAAHAQTIEELQIAVPAGDPQPSTLTKGLSKTGSRHAASLWKVAQEKSDLERALRKAQADKAAIAQKAKELIATETERKEEIDTLADLLRKEREHRTVLEDGVVRLEEQHEDDQDAEL